MTQSKILVVEDDDSIRLPLIDTLREQADVEVDGARDGVEALHQVSTTRYALVVLDVVMPHMTGIDFLDSLQAMAVDPSVKGMDRLPAVIVVTGASPEDVPNSAIEERFSSLVRRVLRKPVDIAELTRSVRAIVA